MKKAQYFVGYDWHLKTLYL